MSVNQQKPRKRQVSVGKHVITVYSIGWLAILAGIANVTIRFWERSKVMPLPVLNCGTWRYYTALELEEYAKIIKSRARLPNTRDATLKGSLAEKRREIAIRYKDLVKTESAPPKELVSHPRIV